MLCDRCPYDLYCVSSAYLECSTRPSSTFFSNHDRRSIGSVCMILPCCLMKMVPWICWIHQIMYCGLPCYEWYKKKVNGYLVFFLMFLLCPHHTHILENTKHYKFQGAEDRTLNFLPVTTAWPSLKERAYKKQVDRRICFSRLGSQHPQKQWQNKRDSRDAQPASFSTTIRTSQASGEVPLIAQNLFYK